jgi:hypothetical protein
MAVILLLASQISFQRFREQEEEQAVQDWFDQGRERARQLDKEAAMQKIEEEVAEGNIEQDPINVNNEQPTVTKSLLEQHPYLNQPFAHFKDLKPIVYKAEGDSPKGPVVDVVSPEPTVTDTPLFVQNEEQAESDLWTKTAISKEEYFETSAAVNLDPYNDAPPPEVAEYIELVKSKRISLRDVPKEYIMAVKARI